MVGFNTGVQERTDGLPTDVADLSLGDPSFLAIVELNIPPPSFTRPDGAA